MAAPVIKYATYDLQSSIDVARVLFEQNGSGSADEVAALLGYKSRNNGAFLGRLASARAYGLVAGQSDNLSTTPLAVGILRPDFPATAVKAKLDAFESVQLNREVLREYHGKVLPEGQGLANALQVKWSIPPKSAPHIAGRLLESAEQAGLFRVAGNRTKMIRPTGGGLGLQDEPDHEQDNGHGHNGAGVTGGGGGGGGFGHIDMPATGARTNKLIDGALDLLPDISEPWDEDQLRQWLAFFESALRVVYRLPGPQP